jgi:peptidoglycan/xylan/chitin deacetylase (PgdA/CDA1 family)
LANWARGLQLSVSESPKGREHETAGIFLATVTAAVVIWPVAAGASHTIVRWHDNHAAAVSVTFDDGLYLHTTTGAALLNARGLKGTFYVMTEEGWNHWDGYWQAWSTLASQGHEIGSHTVTHAHLTQLTEAQIIQELAGSQSAIEANVAGQDCLTLAYPFGEDNALVRDLSADYYIAARDVWSPGYLNLYPEDVVGGYVPVDFYALGSFPYDYPSLTNLATLEGHLDAAELMGGWYMPHIHELDEAAASTLLAQFLDELLVRDVWVETVATVVRYMQERMLCSLTVVSESPTGITLNLAGLLDPTVFDVPLTLRSTVPASWTGIQVTQGGSVQPVVPGVEGSETVVYYHAVPNGGTITLVPGALANLPPAVNAGPDKEIMWPANSVILDATVSDDGLPIPPGTTTPQWSQVSGPAQATFLVGGAVDTGVTFPQSGTYVLKLTVSDGALSTSDTATVVVKPPAPTVVEVSVNASNGDAEEATSGTVTLNSSDIELVYDSYKSAGNQTVGLRFAGLTIPPGATIANAYVQFTVDETTSSAANLVVRAQAADSAPVFSTASKNVSSRAKTTAQVGWVPAAWTKVGEAGTAQRTPNLSAVVQEVVNRPGWKSGNALAIIVTGTKQRIAVAYDLSASQAPKLHVEYQAGAPVNLAPVVSAGPDKSILLPANTVSLDGSAADDGLPNPPGKLTLQWSKVSGPGNVTFLSAQSAATSATFSAAGLYVLMLTASDSSASTSDEVSVSVQGSQTTAVDVWVAASAADAEESAAGTVYLNSSDLELVYDSYNSAGNQTVGLRFAGVAVPPTAAILSAYVQFTTDEATSDAASLLIRGEGSDNAALFAKTQANISARPKTAAQAAWAPAAWSTVGEAGLAQRTPDLKAIVQEIVNRPGWANGNSMALIVTGTGTRTAFAYDGTAGKAAMLHIEYTLGVQGQARAYNPQP